MKVVDLVIDRINFSFTHTMSSATSRASGGSKCIVRLRTDDDIEGLGEAPGGEGTHEEILRAYPAVEGQDPFRIEAIVERLPGPHRGLYGPTPTAISALEMALWDIQGKAVADAKSVSASSCVNSGAQTAIRLRYRPPSRSQTGRPTALP